MAKREPAKGFTCTCGEFYKYPVYVYAHWDEILNFQCEKCKARWEIIRGRATKTRKRP